MKYILIEYDPTMATLDTEDGVNLLSPAGGYTLFQANSIEALIAKAYSYLRSVGRAK